jgi:hypothetical protein
MLAKRGQLGGRPIVAPVRGEQPTGTGAG